MIDQKLVRWFLGSAVRWMIAILAGWLLRSGYINADDVDSLISQVADLIEPVLLGLGVLVWSFYQKYHARKAEEAAFRSGVGAGRVSEP